MQVSGEKGTTCPLSSRHEATDVKGRVLSDCWKHGSIHQSHGTKIQGKCRVVFSDRRCKLYYCLESFRIGKVRNTSVIGEDTNVLVILSFLLTRKGKHLIFTTDTIGKGTGNHATQRDLLNSLENLDKISFCTPYSLTGCDSISRLFGIGRPVAIIKLLQNSILRKDNRLFSTKKTLHLNQS